MEIYVDILILENIIIVYFLLTVTFNILAIEIKKKRKIIASVIGGIYTLVMVIPEMKNLATIPVQIVMAVVIIFLSVEEKRVILIAKGVVGFLLSSFVLSGVCFALSLWQNKFFLSSPYTIVDYSVKYLIFAIIAIYFATDRIVTLIKDRAVVSNFIYNLEIIYNGKIYETKAFLDTGNELREPITNLPCIIVEEEYIENLVEESRNTYYIPYSSIGHDGRLIGIKADRVRLNREKGKYTEIKAIICPCKNTLSKEGDYNALLSRGVI